MDRNPQTITKRIANIRDFARDMAQIVNEYLVMPAQRMLLSREIYEDAMLIGYVYTLLRFTPASDNGRMRGNLVGVLNVFGVQCVSAILDQTELVTTERGEIDRSLVLEVAKKSDISRIRGTVRQISAQFGSETRFRIAHERGAKFAAFVTRDLMMGALMGEGNDALRHRLRNIDLLWEKFRQ